MSESKCNLLKEVIENISNYTKEMTGLEVLNYSGANYLSKIIFKKNSADIVILPSQYFYPWPNFLSETKNSPYSWET